MDELHEDEKLGRAFDWAQFRRLLRFAAPHKALFFWSALVLFAIFGLELLGPYWIRAAIDGPVAAILAGGAVEENRAQLTRYVVFFLGAATLLGLFRYSQVILMSRAGQRVVYDLRVALFAHLQKLSLRFYDHNPVGRLVTRVTSDVENLSELFTSGVVIFVFDTLRIVGTVAILFWIDAKLAFVVLAFAPLLVLGAFFFQKLARDAYRKVRIHLARLNSYLQEVIGGIRVVQAFRQEAKVFRKFSAINEDYLHANLRSVFFFAILFPIVDQLVYCALGAVLWVGGSGILEGTLTFGEFQQFWIYLQLLFEPVRELGEKYNLLQAATASSERIFKILDAPVEVASPASPRRLEKAAGQVEFRDVHFSYDGTTPILKGVSFFVRPGEKIALVGATGAGKSTILSLLVRFYDPQDGQVLMDGMDLRELDPGELRSKIGFVPQDVFLFAGDIAENIHLGRPGIDETKVRETARLAQASSFIESKPGGYGAAVAERGMTFSLGERQLLAFARALAGGPAIVVLDEATANIDTETERKIQEATRELLRGRTAIVAAHRLSTVREADRILVLHKGELREEGTHRELLAKGGIYSKLYRLQFSPLDERVSS